VFQLIAVGIVYLLFLARESEIGFAEVCLIAAITGVAGILPLAINGIGVTEGTITLAGVALGADYEDAAVAAILLRVVVLPLKLRFVGCFIGGSRMGRLRGAWQRETVVGVRSRGGVKAAWLEGVVIRGCCGSRRFPA